MILRTHWLNIVKDLNTGKSDKQIEAMSDTELVDTINAHDSKITKLVQADISAALNDFENCLTTPGLDDIYNNYPHLHTNSAFLKAYEICKQNLNTLKI
jgi:hypothetical protein